MEDAIIITDNQIQVNEYFSYFGYDAKFSTDNQFIEVSYVYTPAYPVKYIRLETTCEVPWKMQ